MRFGKLMVTLSMSGLMLALAGCGAPEVDSEFEAGSGDTFGTLVDDRGTFTMELDPQTQTLKSIAIANTPGGDDGSITVPTTDNAELAIEREDGSSLSLELVEDNVLVVVRDDPTAGDLQLEVPREDLGELGDIFARRRGVTQEIPNCEENRDFVDSTCSIIGNIEIADLTALIVAQLEAAGQSFPFADSIISGFLERYLGLVIDFCAAWDEYRDAGGDPC